MAFHFFFFFSAPSQQHTRTTRTLAIQKQRNSNSVSLAHFAAIEPPKVFNVDEMRGGCNLSKATNMNYTQHKQNNTNETRHTIYRVSCGDDDQVKTMLNIAKCKRLRFKRQSGATATNPRRAACSLGRPSHYNLMAMMTIVVVMMMLLMVALAAVECHHNGRLLADERPPSIQRHRLKTRSSLGDDEEELTLGQQFGDLWQPPTRPPGSVERHSLQSAAVVGQTERLTRKRENEDQDQVFDPFASVFDDYLREASGIVAQPTEEHSPSPESSKQVLDQPGLDDSDNRIAESATRGRASGLAELIDEDEQNSNNNKLQPTRGVGLIIEEDESPSMSNSNSRESRGQQANGEQSTLQLNERQKSTTSGGDEDNKLALESWHGKHAVHMTANNDMDQPNMANDDAGDNLQQTTTTTQLGNEIKLLFAWRSLPTNKCSKSCGRGRRVLHLSCIDLKYNVRVENELCLGANLGQPSDLSDEPCNEIDCEPNWQEVSLERCDRPRDECRSTSVFKRLECVMIDRYGNEVGLSESRCNSTTNNKLPAAPTAANNDDDESSLIDLNEQIDKERNNILSNDLPIDMDQKHLNGESVAPSQVQPRHHHHHTSGTRVKLLRSNEPFYEPGDWSECSGAPCGQLGRRHRQLTCRLFLSRSSRYVDLPDSSCASNGADEPDRDEPCYMDCGPSGMSIKAGGDSVESSELLDTQTSLNISDRTTSTTSSSKSPFVSSDDATMSKQAESALEAGIKPTDLDDETIYDLEAARHVWRHGAWTKCSAECLAGSTESIVECWDKVAESSVEEKFCNSLTKPAPISKTCNEIPCAPQWHPGPFSNCSSVCGSAGVRVRDVLCVRRVPIDDVRVNHKHRNHNHHHYQYSPDAAEAINRDDDAITGQLMLASYKLEIVPEQQCIEQQQLNSSSGAFATTTSGDVDQQQHQQQQQVKPHSMEPCNRHDCLAQWQVGPWSECSVSEHCGQPGVRNRSVICVQEFASHNGPTMNETEQHHKEDANISPDLREAIQLAAANWKPGKAIQVPFSECYRQFHSVPQLSEHCRDDSRQCPKIIEDQTSATKWTTQADTLEGASIDSDPLQDYRMISPDGSLMHGGGPNHNHHHQLRRRTITLKLGGRAQIIEGWNVKIRCRLVARRSHNDHNHNRHNNHVLVNSKQQPVAFGRNHVEWRKDGVRIFAPNTTVAEKKLLEETDNSILNYGTDESLPDDKYSMMAADEPPEAQAAKRAQRMLGGVAVARTGQQRTTNPRVLRVRSWSSSGATDLSSFQFVPRKGGRFSLVKENTLRIKRLKLDDSGLYTCTNGPFNESIEINVVSRKRLSSAGLDQNQPSPNNYNQ